MLPRSQSIFHLGEEAGSLVGAAAMNGGGATTRGGVREGLVVGLQILVHNQHHHHGSSGGHHHQQKHGRRHAHAASIVLKQMVGPLPPPPRAAAARHGDVSWSFLKACSLCRMELSYNKDVFMYRGDQGFCSEECRQQQILVDEKREREAIGRERRGLAQHHHHHTPIPGRPRKTLLAVA